MGWLDCNLDPKFEIDTENYPLAANFVKIGDKPPVLIVIQLLHIQSSSKKRQLGSEAPQIQASYACIIVLHMYILV